MPYSGRCTQLLQSMAIVVFVCGCGGIGGGGGRVLHNGYQNTRSANDYFLRRKFYEVAYTNSNCFCVDSI